MFHVPVPQIFLKYFNRVRALTDVLSWQTLCSIKCRLTRRLKPFLGGHWWNLKSQARFFYSAAPNFLYLFQHLEFGLKIFFCSLLMTVVIPIGNDKMCFCACKKFCNYSTLILWHCIHRLPFLHLMLSTLLSHSADLFFFSAIIAFSTPFFRLSVKMVWLCSRCTISNRLP